MAQSAVPAPASSRFVAGDWDASTDAWLTDPVTT